MSTDTQKCALRCSEVADLHATNGEVVLIGSELRRGWRYLAVKHSMLYRVDGG